VLGQCLAYGQATPYLPVRDIVQHLCAVAAGDPLETRLAAVRRRLAALGSVTEEDMALVLQLLDLPVAPALLTRLTPEARQARTFALLGHLLRHEAQRQPLVLAVESVHWIDLTSAAWLASLVDWLAGTAVLLLVTARSGYQPPWGAHAAVTQLALPPLRAEDSQAIVATVPGTAQLLIARRWQIVAYWAGNPFFVEELAWHAVEHGLSRSCVPSRIFQRHTTRVRKPLRCGSTCAMRSIHWENSDGSSLTSMLPRPWLRAWTIPVGRGGLPFIGSNTNNRARRKSACSRCRMQY
jgi:predicted ATPase